MTLLFCYAFSAILCPRGHDTAGEEYEENQTKSITTLSTILYPVTKAYHAQFVSVIPLLEGLQSHMYSPLQLTVVFDYRLRIKSLH